RDEETIAEIRSLHTDGDYQELAKRFSSRIAFGTAGLRARMAAGVANMNSLVVIQATQGLARYACENIPNARERGVVVGHDHRWRSKRFAELASTAFRREGMKVYLLDGLVHTPMVPFSASSLGCALGLMITASHNPANDNGYKVYWENAVQIIPPHDGGIARMIDKSLEVDEEAWAATCEPWQGTEDMKARYFEMVKQLSRHPANNASTSLQFMYTPMHGVGLPFAQTAFEAFGFPSKAFNIVAQQAQPDPAFPTVSFPNPEEKGALDLAIASASQREDVNIVLANDPDADRFCAAEKLPSGEWRVFTGDQLGALLGSWALRGYKESGAPIEKLAMAASTVSSKMLRAMAKKEGFVFRETLTGFKFLGNEALTLEDEGLSCVFAYEEAIGYMVGKSIRDKDGVTALVSFCEMATALAKEGKTVSQHLDDLYLSYGYFKTSNSYFICRDPAKTDRIFSTLRFGVPDPKAIDASPLALALPRTLAGFEITYLRDLTVGYDSSTPDHKPTLLVDPSSHMISFAVGSTSEGEGEGVEVTGTVRTSGTEPKFYLEGSGNDRQAVESKLANVREALGDEWLRWKENGLESA
ncbi:hypothetical protein MNV49_005282, partial [Pseudohyphozyma bogoriensis]